MGEGSIKAAYWAKWESQHVSLRQHPILLHNYYTLYTIQHPILLKILLTLHSCMTSWPNKYDTPGGGKTLLLSCFSTFGILPCHQNYSQKVIFSLMFIPTHTHSISPEVNDDFSCWLSLKQAPLYSTRLLNSTCINTVGLQFNPHICYCPTHWKLFDKFTIYLHSFHLINSIYTVFAHIGYLTWYLNWAGTSAHIRIAKS